MTHRYSRYFTL